MTKKKQTKAFQAEVKEILNLMIHSLYSQKEIFLRELVSNSSDALDKLRYEEQVNQDLKTGEGERHIRISSNKDEKTLTISDNGVGMTYDEVVENIGRIAYSGTKNFLGKLKEIKDKPELIGQFGVGFYSSFIVAKEVVVHTQKAGTTEGTVWSSKGDGEYNLEPKARPEGCGTTLTLHLKEADKEEEMPQDFTDQWTLKSIIKKYSDFIEYPIKMMMEKQEPEKDKDGKVLEGKTKTIHEDSVLNSQKALWTKSPREIKEEEYNEFYKHITSDWTEPLETIHYRAEGAQEFSALMYIPGMLPFDYNQRDMKYGLSLYVKRIFIMENCSKLVPQYLRFIKGLVDSSDLPLNVSREMLQQDRRIEAIQKALVTKILRTLQTKLDKKRADYEKIWDKFGQTIKEGIASDHSNKDAVTKLSLFKSSHSDKWTTLKEYIDRMDLKQKDIYYITGESMTQIKDCAYLERLKEKKFEVLYLIDPVDEWVMNTLTEYEGKKLISVTKDNLELDSEEEKKEKEATKKDQESKFKPLTDTIQKNLDSDIKEVKLSDRLVDSPACLVASQNDPSAHMEKMMEAMGQTAPKSKRILELNPNHPILEKMTALSDDKKKLWSEILYNQALLSEGSQLKNPTLFSKQISELMLEVQ